MHFIQLWDFTPKSLIWKSLPGNWFWKHRLSLPQSNCMHRKFLFQFPSCFMGNIRETVTYKSLRSLFCKLTAWYIAELCCINFTWHLFHFTVVSLRTLEGKWKLIKLLESPTCGITYFVFQSGGTLYSFNWLWQGNNSKSWRMLT